MMECFVIFCFGALGYGGLELAFSGHTHWTMLLAGGLCLCGLRGLSLLRIGFWVRTALSALLITVVEFAFGLVFNRFLGWNIWDYSAQWGNFEGQICPLYSGYWFLLSALIQLFFKWMDSGGVHSRMRRFH